MASLGGHLAQDTQRHQRDDRRGGDDAGRVTARAELRPALASVYAPVGEALAREREPASRRPLTHDERRRMPEHDPLRRELTVDERLPEAVAVEVARPGQKGTTVRGVV